MKITTIVQNANLDGLTPLQRRVLAYLEEHPDEVFGYRDEALASDLSSKPSGIGFSLWALNRAGLIGKQSVGGKIYFGSHEAVRSVRQALGLSDTDAFERAYANLEKIRAEVGNMDVLGALDAVRAGY